MNPRRWTDDDDQFLRVSYEKFTNEILSNKMNRSPGAIKDRAARLGVNKGGSRKRWSSNDHNYLANNFGKLSVAVIAKKLGRSHAAIANRGALFFRKNQPCDLVFGDLYEAHFNPFLTGKIGGKANNGKH